MSVFPEAGSITFQAISACLLIFLISLFVTRRMLWNIFDPLWRALLNISINVVEVLYFCPGKWEASYVVLAYVMFLIGLKLGSSGRGGKVAQLSPADYRGPGPKMTIVLLSFAAMLLLIYDGFVAWRIGPGLLSGESPDVIKVTVTAGGFGIFKYFAVAGGLLFLPLLVHAYWIHRLRVLSFFGLIFFLFNTFIFGFSKAGFVFIVFDFGIILHYYKISTGYSVIKNRSILIAMAIGAIPAYMVVSQVASLRTTTPDRVLLDSLIGLGAGSYMYFCLGGWEAFDRLTYLKKLSYFFDNLLSPLRIKPWESVPYGAFIEDYLTGGGTPGFGANPYLFHSGHLLFGWGGALYCLALGLLIAKVRSLRTNLITFFVLVYMAFSWVADPGTAHSAMVAFLIVSPVLLTLKLGAMVQGRRLFMPVIVARGLRRYFRTVGQTPGRGTENTHFA